LKPVDVPAIVKAAIASANVISMADVIGMAHVIGMADVNSMANLFNLVQMFERFYQQPFKFVTAVFKRALQPKFHSYILKH
jgi:hypothetical protein